MGGVNVVRHDHLRLGCLVRKAGRSLGVNPSLAEGYVRSLTWFERLPATPDPHLKAAHGWGRPTLQRTSQTRSHSPRKRLKANGVGTMAGQESLARPPRARSAHGKPAPSVAETHTFVPARWPDRDSHGPPQVRTISALLVLALRLLRADPRVRGLIWAGRRTAEGIATTTSAGRVSAEQRLFRKTGYRERPCDLPRHQSG